MHANLVATTSGTRLDSNLLRRFLDSVHESDFPRDYRLILYGPLDNMKERSDRLALARKEGLNLALRDSDLVVVTDTDVVLPPVWWGDIEKAFNSDPKIAIVGTRVLGAPHPLQDARLPPPPIELTNVTEKWDYLFDGFVIFRTSFLRETGIRPDAGIGWVEQTKARGYRIVIVNSVTIEHSKK